MTTKRREVDPHEGPYNWQWIDGADCDQPGLRWIAIGDFHGEEVATIMFRAAAAKRAGLDVAKLIRDREWTAEMIVAALNAPIVATPTVDPGPFPQLGDDEERNFTVQYTAALGVTGRVYTRDHLLGILARLFVLHPPIADAYEHARKDEMASPLVALGDELRIIAVGPVTRSGLPPADEADMVTVNFLVHDHAAADFAASLRGLVEGTDATVEVVEPTTLRRSCGDALPSVVRLRRRLRAGEAWRDDIELDMR